ncbi:MAG: glycerophosphodiester phosphodiesterase family protein [Phototrophicaceae bacterium]
MTNPQAIVKSWYADKSALVFGHRGASAYRPMNTIPAFEFAADQGADGVELDVHLTKDGELIIVHDFTIDHTTNGSGTVTDMTLAELKSFDAGSWFGADYAGLQLPTLDEVFEAVGQRLIINVEIKSLSQTADGTEEAVAACIRKHNMSERVIVSSFNPYILPRFRAIDPEIPIGYLLHPASVSDQSHTIVTPSHYEALHYFHEMIGDEELSFALENNAVINTWTVNDPELAKLLVGKGVRGIITDTPDVMIEALA